MEHLYMHVDNFFPPSNSGSLVTLIHSCKYFYSMFWMVTICMSAIFEDQFHFTFEYWHLTYFMTQQCMPRDPSVVQGWLCAAKTWQFKQHVRNINSTHFGSTFCMVTICKLSSILILFYGWILSLNIFYGAARWVQGFWKWSRMVKPHKKRPIWTIH